MILASKRKMPQAERLRVWNGTLKATTGGLTKAMLTKNKRGKIVSKKKSAAAKNQANNLGEWLRKKGDDFFSKGIKKETKKRATKKKETKKNVVKPVVPDKPGDKSGKEGEISVTNIVRGKRKRKKYDPTKPWYKK